MSVIGRFLIGAAVAAAFLFQPGLSAAATGDRLSAAVLTLTNKKAAQAAVDSSLAEYELALRSDPRDWNLRLQRAIAIGYRAKLGRSLGDAKMARDLFQQLNAERPNDPQPLIALASWHIESVNDVGALLAGTMLGAKRATGLVYLDRAVKVAGNRALITSFAALLHACATPKDMAATRRLIDIASKDAASTPLDRELQRRALRLLPALKAGDGKAAATLAATLLPLGLVE